MRLIDTDLLGLTDMEIIMCDGDYKEALKMLIDKIEHAPPIEERKVGEWIEVGIWTDMYTADEIPVFKCSVCENEVLGTGGFDYCPNCGAKMEKGE